jgi:hypothetical protein
MSDFLIQHNLITFTDCYKNKNSIKTLLSPVILDKSYYIRDFVNLLPSPSTTENYRNNTIVRSVDISFISRNSSLDSITPSLLKNFKGLLNKLSTKNSESIIEKIKIIIDNPEEYNNELLDILMSFIYKNIPILIDIFYKIFNFFDDNIIDTYIYKIWTSFILDKEWDIPEIYKTVDVFSSTYDYDLFCIFKIWNKKILAYIYFWKIHNNITKINEIHTLIINQIINYINTNTIYLRHMIDILLDELILLNLDISKNKKLRNIDLSTIPSSSKFKIELLIFY